jgi:hypothetical protein
METSMDSGMQAGHAGLVNERVRQVHRVEHRNVVERDTDQRRKPRDLHQEDEPEDREQQSVLVNEQSRSSEPGGSDDTDRQRDHRNHGDEGEHADRSRIGVGLGDRARPEHR